jgi:hypothetical protein
MKRSLQSSENNGTAPALPEAPFLERRGHGKTKQILSGGTGTGRTAQDPSRSQAAARAATNARAVRATSCLESHLTRPRTSVSRAVDEGLGGESCRGLRISSTGAGSCNLRILGANSLFEERHVRICRGLAGRAYSRPASHDPDNSGPAGLGVTATVRSRTESLRTAGFVGGLDASFHTTGVLTTESAPPSAA